MARLFKETSHENGWPTVNKRDKIQEELWGKKVTNKIDFSMGIEIGRNGLINEGFLLNVQSFDQGVQLLLDREKKIEEEDKFQRSIAHVYNAVQMNDDKNKSNAAKEVAATQQQKKQITEEEEEEEEKQNEDCSEEEEKEADEEEDEEDEIFTNSKKIDSNDNEDLFPDTDSNFDEGDNENDNEGDDEEDNEGDDEFTPQNELDQDMDIADSLDDDFSI